MRTSTTKRFDTDDLPDVEAGAFEFLPHAAALCGTLHDCGATSDDVEDFRVGTDGFWEARCKPERHIFLSLFRYVAGADRRRYTDSAFVFRGTQIITNYCDFFSEYSAPGDVIVWRDGTVYLHGDNGWNKRSDFDAVEAELLVRFDADVAKGEEVGDVEAA